MTFSFIHPYMHVYTFTPSLGRYLFFSFQSFVRSTGVPLLQTFVPNPVDTYMCIYI